MLMDQYKANLKHHTHKWECTMSYFHSFFESLWFNTRNTWINEQEKVAVRQTWWGKIGECLTAAHLASSPSPLVPFLVIYIYRIHFCLFVLYLQLTPKLFNHIAVILHGPINNGVWIVHFPLPLCSYRICVMSKV